MSLPKNTRSNLKHTDWTKMLFQGMFGISPLLFYFCLLPLVISDYFVWGLEDIPTIVALCIFPIGYGILFLIKLPLEYKIFIGSIGKLLLSTGLLLQALITQFPFDDANVSTTILSTVILSCGFCVSLLDTSVWMQKQYSPYVEIGKNSLIYYGGIGLIISILAVINLLTLSKVIFLLFLACWYLISPLATLREKYWIIEQKEKVVILRKESTWEIIKKCLIKISIDSLGIIIFIFWIYTSFAYPFTSFGWGLLGISFGILIYRSLILLMKSIKMAYYLIQFISWAIMACVITITAAFWLQDITRIAQGDYKGFGMISGIILGGIVGEQLQFVKPFVLRHQFFFAFRLLFLLLVETVGIAAGVELVWIIKKNPQYVEWGWWIIGGVELFAFICIGLTLIRLRSIFSTLGFSTLFNREKLKILPQNKTRKGIQIAILVLGIVLPILGILLQTNNYSKITIYLPQVMYTVDGNPVSKIDLKERSAQILLYSPNPIGISHGETIRLGKSIRLGGYYYGLGSTPKSQAIEWIGTTQDVYSLGMCGAIFQPTDIDQIQNLNPDVKFYYMAFATTLFENPYNIFTNGTWQNSHYPSMKFNDTMHEWTLKYKNGTEAFGVRRTPSHLDAHLMDLGRSEWADYFAWIYTQKVQEFHANGVAIDEVMWRSYWDVDIEELRDYCTKDQIKATCYSWLERLDQQTNIEVITQAFWNSAQRYQNGTWGEIAFRCGGQYGNRVDDRMADVWYEKNDWVGIVEDLRWHGETNRSYIWAAWYERGDAEALEYAIATYLMGKPNDNTNLVFHPQPIFDGGYGDNNMAGYAISTVQEEVIAHQNLFDLELGDALGGMKFIRNTGGSYYQREFTNGIVLVNPFHAHIPGFSK